MRRRRAAPDGAGLIVIGCSAGGPPALQEILPGLPAGARTAVIVAQHMPARFTTLFASRLARLCALHVCEPADADPVVPGRIYIAPGGRQSLLARDGSGVRFTVRARERDERYAPSADLLMRSASGIYGAAVLAVLLTGMGSDGVEGLRAVKEAGGSTIAESEATAAVFGMPRGAIRAGLADRVLDRPEIGAALARACLR